MPWVCASAHCTRHDRTYEDGGPSTALTDSGSVGQVRSPTVTFSLRRVALGPPRALDSINLSSSGLFMNVIKDFSNAFICCFWVNMCSPLFFFSHINWRVSWATGSHRISDGRICNVSVSDCCIICKPISAFYCTKRKLHSSDWSQCGHGKFGCRKCAGAAYPR